VKDKFYVVKKIGVGHTSPFGGEKAIAFEDSAIATGLRGRTFRSKLKSIRLKDI
jgi:hypothetical protein